MFELALNAPLGPDLAPLAEELFRTADLQQQRAMAFWAKIAALAAVFSASATGFGVFLIWRTLLATQATLSEAKSATAAANRTADITRQIGEDNLRAHVLVTWDGTQIHKSDAGWTIQVPVEAMSAGVLPARSVRTTMRAIFVEWETGVELELTQVSQKSFDLAPGAPPVRVAQAKFFINIDQARMILEGNASVRIDGEIKYVAIRIPGAKGLADVIATTSFAYDVRAPRPEANETFHIERVDRGEAAT